jgi:hypothetical protein
LIFYKARAERKRGYFGNRLDSNIALLVCLLCDLAGFGQTARANNRILATDTREGDNEYQFVERRLASIQ